MWQFYLLASYGPQYHCSQEIRVMENKFSFVRIIISEFYGIQCRNTLLLILIRYLGNIPRYITFFLILIRFLGNIP